MKRRKGGTNEQFGQSMTGSSICTRFILSTILISLLVVGASSLLTDFLPECPSPGEEGKISCAPNYRDVLLRPKSFLLLSGSTIGDGTQMKNGGEDTVVVSSTERPPVTTVPQPPAATPLSEGPPSETVVKEEVKSETIENGEREKPPIATFDEWSKQKLRQEHVKVPPVVIQPVQQMQPTVATASAAETVAIPNPTITQTHIVPTPETVVQQVVVSVAATRNYASRECGAKIIYANVEAENTKAVLNDKEKDDYMRNPCDKAQNKELVIELCETIQPRSFEIANFELFSSGPKSVRFSTAERFPSQEWTVVGEYEVAESRSVHTLPVPPEKRSYAKFVKVDLLSHHGSEHYCTVSLVRVLGFSIADEYEEEATAAAARLPVTQQVSPPISLPVNTLNVETEETIKTATETVTEATTVTSEKTVERNTVEENEKKGVDDVFTKRRFLRLFDSCDTCPSPNGRFQLDICRAPFVFCAPSKSATVFNSSCSLPTKATVVRPFVKQTSWMKGKSPLSSVSCCSSRGRSRRVSIAFIQRLQATEARRRKNVNEQTTLPTQIPPPPTVEHRKGTTTTVPSSPLPSPSAVVLEEKKDNEEIPQQSLPIQQQQPSPMEQQSSSPQLPPSPPVIPVQTTPHKTTMHRNPSMFEGLPASTSSHKESVFMKLNKRIAALELNMSLSTEYLSELSRQYVAHTDEQKKALDKTRQAAERAAIEAARALNETVRDELFTLRKEMDSLSTWLASLRAQAGALITRRLPPLPFDVYGRREEEVVIDAKSRENDISELRVCLNTNVHRDLHGPKRRDEDDANNESERERVDEEEEEDEGDEGSGMRDVGHFGHHKDGIWTTEQVLYAVLTAQLSTVVLVLLLQFCYRYWSHTDDHVRVDTVPREEIERLIDARLADLRRSQKGEEDRREAGPSTLPLPLVVVPSDPPASNCTGMKKERQECAPCGKSPSVSSSSSGTSSAAKRASRKKRSRRSREPDHPPMGEVHCRKCGGEGRLDWDSAMDSSLPSPSQTGSEEEEGQPINVSPHSTNNQSNSTNNKSPHVSPKK